MMSKILYLAALGLSSGNTMCVLNFMSYIAYFLININLFIVTRSWMNRFVFDSFCFEFSTVTREFCSD